MPEAREVARLVEEAHRRHWATVLAATVRLTRDLDLAEDCAQDAYVRALTAWPRDVPDNPAGWLTTVARRAALDRMRREQTLRRKLPLLVVEDAPDVPEQPTDLLRLVFTCCHPALQADARLALTLRLVCGLTTAEIGRVLLTKEATVAARITRAKQKIARAGIPYRVPEDHELGARLDPVLTVIHLAYTAGHTAVGARLVRQDLTDRAVDLARMLVAQMPGHGEPQGLLAVLLFAQARGASRVDEQGDLVLLADQDRSRWDRTLLAEALGLATRSLSADAGRFALQAAIAGLHMTAPSWDATDWAQVVRMYDALLTRWPSAVVELNRLAAASFVPGVDLVEVLAGLDRLATDPSLATYTYLPSTRADVLARLGRVSEAASAYDEAAALCANETERRFLVRRRASVVASRSDS